MYLKTVCIYDLRAAANGTEVKAVLGLLDKVLHIASTTVELDYLIGFRLHCGNDKGVHIGTLSSRFLNLEDHSSRFFPGTCLIFKLAVCDGVI